MEECFFQCPYCWEQISMLIDTSVKQQTYVEDCEICCNPLEVNVVTDNSEVISVEANFLE